MDGFGASRNLRHARNKRKKHKQATTKSKSGMLLYGMDNLASGRRGARGRASNGGDIIPLPRFVLVLVRRVAVLCRSTYQYALCWTYTKYQVLILIVYLTRATYVHFVCICGRIRNNNMYESLRVQQYQRYHGMHSLASEVIRADFVDRTKELVETRTLVSSSEGGRGSLD